MTKRVPTRMVTTAASRKKRRAARKVAAMSPEMTETHIPESMTLEHRAVCQPVTDEPLMLRTADRHVVALVESWTPELAN